MKRLFWISALLLGAMVGQPALVCAENASPAGTWQVSVMGAQKGTLMMTFSNNFTVTGYGITRKQFGFITLAGTWSYDTKGNVVAAYLQTVNGASSAFTLTMRALSPGRFRGHATGTSGGYQCLGEQPESLPDLSGTWNAIVIRKGKPSNEQFTTTISTNYPYVFNLTGQGLSQTGSYTLSGMLMATSRDKVSATVARTIGTDTQGSSAAGVFKRARSKMTLVGSDETGAHLSEIAVR